MTLHLLTSYYHYEDSAIQIRLPDALDRKYGNEPLNCVPTAVWSNDFEKSFGVVSKLYRTGTEFIAMIYKLAIAVIVSQATRST